MAKTCRRLCQLIEELADGGLIVHSGSAAAFPAACLESEQTIERGRVSVFHAMEFHGSLLSDFPSYLPQLASQLRVPRHLFQKSRVGWHRYVRVGSVRLVNCEKTVGFSR